MAKKGIPEWLNSSLWSSSPPPPIDDRLFRNPPATSVTPPTPPIVERPPLSPSPSAISTAPAPPLPVRPPSKSEINDLQNGTGNDGAVSESTPASSVEDVSRKAQVVAELSKKVIDLKELRKIASQGLPDDAGIHSLVWKSEVTRKMDKSKGGDSNDPKIESPGVFSRSEITHEDHPLSLGTTSLWNKFFKDCGTKGRMATNDSLRVASLWHSIHAISQQLSPVNCTGIELLETDTFDLHFFQSLPGTKFFVVCEPGTPHMESLFRYIYELYTDYVLKNLFYEIGMPILRAFRHQPYSSCKDRSRCIVRTMST